VNFGFMVDEDTLWQVNMNNEYIKIWKKAGR